MVWARVEPRNQGAWGSIQPFLRDDLPSGGTLRYIGRDPAASPATGSNKVHQVEQSAIIQRILAR